MHEALTDQLERSSTASALVARATRLVPAPDRRGAGGQRSGRQPAGGPEVLCYRSPPGAPRWLSAEQLVWALASLQQDAEADGFRG